MILIAGCDAPRHVKRSADFICDGIDDQVELQAAFDAAMTVYVVGNLNLSQSTIPAWTSLVGLSPDDPGLIAEIERRKEKWSAILKAVEE